MSAMGRKQTLAALYDLALDCPSQQSVGALAADQR